MVRKSKLLQVLAEQSVLVPLAVAGTALSAALLPVTIALRNAAEPLRDKGKENHPIVLAHEVLGGLAFASVATLVSAPDIIRGEVNQARQNKRRRQVRRAR